MQRKEFIGYVFRIHLIRKFDNHIQTYLNANCHNFLQHL